RSRPWYESSGVMSRLARVSCAQSSVAHAVDRGASLYAPGPERGFAASRTRAAAYPGRATRGAVAGMSAGAASPGVRRWRGHIDPGVRPRGDGRAVLARAGGCVFSRRLCTETESGAMAAGLDA